MQHVDFAQLFDYPSENPETDANIKEHLLSCIECQKRLAQVHEFQIFLLKSAEKKTKDISFDREPDCPDDQLIGDYVESVLLHRAAFSLPKSEQQWMDGHLEECDACLKLVVDTYRILRDMDWDVSLEGTIPEPTVRPIPPATLIPLLIVLRARVVRSRMPRVSRSQGGKTREEQVWQLVTDRGDEHITLPSDIAQCCYGKAEQQVTLRLYRIADGADFEPQLEVSPPPTQNSLKFNLSFANGDKRSLTIPVPRSPRSKAWSQKCQALPAEAFGTEEWEVSIEYVL